ncbi:MAG: segregation and condensation protein A [Gammaproteobacteria bacterium]|nr:segregation and condensation protein A [Gammaproteobacteria bacterium]
MANHEMTKEEHILRMMKKVLTDVAKDTYVRPGLKHPLSENTVLGIRDCLALISAREKELVEASGRSMNMRPHFIDEPQHTVVVPLTDLKGRKSDPDKNH